MNKGMAPIIALLIAIVILGGGIGGYVYFKNKPVVCPPDTKQCPDGSYVSRVPPKCEFQECPVVASTTTPISTAAVTTTPTSTAEMVGWKTYRNEKYGFSFKYPSDYKVTEKGNSVIISGTSEKYHIPTIEIKPKQSFIWNDAISGRDFVYNSEENTFYIRQESDYGSQLPSFFTGYCSGKAGALNREFIGNNEKPFYTYGIGDAGAHISYYLGILPNNFINITVDRSEGGKVDPNWDKILASLKVERLMEANCSNSKILNPAKLISAEPKIINNNSEVLIKWSKTSVPVYLYVIPINEDEKIGPGNSLLGLDSPIIQILDGSKLYNSNQYEYRWKVSQTFCMQLKAGHDYRLLLTNNPSMGTWENRSKWLTKEILDNSFIIHAEEDIKGICS